MASSGALLGALILLAAPVAHGLPFGNGHGTYKEKAGKIGTLSFSGDLQCPCFCSVLHGDGASPFWDDHKGITDDNVAWDECATTCFDGKDAAVRAKMPFCGEHVDYTFCVRKFRTDETVVTATAIEDADAVAKLCHGDTFWEEGTDCDASVKRGTCYLAFPKCAGGAGAGDAALPLKTCSSFCVNERIECRRGGSAFGHLDAIKIVCNSPGIEGDAAAGGPNTDAWASADGPDNAECTGGAGRARGASGGGAAIAFLAGVLAAVALLR